jgi:hypothetical protein
VIVQKKPTSPGDIFDFAEIEEMQMSRKPDKPQALNINKIEINNFGGSHDHAAL